MTTNDSKDQGREAFEAFASEKGLPLDRLVSDTRYESLQTECAWQGYQAALARDEASVQEPDLWASADTNYCTSDKWVADKLEVPLKPYYASPAASSAATVSDAARVGLIEHIINAAVDCIRHDVSPDWQRSALRSRLNAIFAATAVAQDERATFEADTRFIADYVLAKLNKKGCPGQWGDYTYESIIAAGYVRQCAKPRAASSAMAPLTSDSDAAVDAFLAEVRAELIRARAKFPGDRIMTIALAEEFGELCKAVLDECSANVRKEAVQTAVMCARVVLDGDGSVNDWRAERGLDPLVSAQSTNGVQS